MCQYDIAFSSCSACVFACTYPYTRNRFFIYPLTISILFVFSTTNQVGSDQHGGIEVRDAAAPAALTSDVPAGAVVGVGVNCDFGKAAIVHPDANFQNNPIQKESVTFVRGRGSKEEEKGRKGRGNEIGDDDGSDAITGVAGNRRVQILSVTSADMEEK